MISLGGTHARYYTSCPVSAWNFCPGDRGLDAETAVLQAEWNEFTNYRTQIP
jgi:hypothetical protein